MTAKTLAIAGVVLALGGCGGSSTDTASNESPVTLTTSATADPKQQLADFLAAVKPYRERGVALEDALNAAVDSYDHDRSVAHLKQLSPVFHTTAMKLQMISHDMAAVTPPPKLAGAYTGWVGYVSTASATMDDAAAAAKTGDIQHIADVFTAVDRTPAKRFKTALIQQLSENGIAVPGWIQTMGGG